MFSTVAAEEQEAVLPAQVLDHLPDVAVVGDPRQDEHEDRADDHGCCAAAEDALPVLSPATLRYGHAVWHLREPIVEGHPKRREPK